MNPRKQKEKDRRRARKLAEEAWEAANSDNLDLAEKIIRRAVAAQPDNPVLWNDQGLLLGLRRKDAESAESYRTAISLAPTFPAPYSNLAALRVRQGFIKEAIGMQARAVKQSPENAEYTAKLEAYQALAEPPSAPSAVPRADRSANPPDVDLHSHDATFDWVQRLLSLDWLKLGDYLTRDGCVRIDGLVDPDECRRLRSMFDDDSLFGKTVTMDQPEFGLGVYRYFKSPISIMADRLRRAVYPHVAHIANRWRQLFSEPRQHPLEWESFRDECREAGQGTPTPILLKYGPGGFNALHRDLRGKVYFPIQMAVVLSQLADQSNLHDGFQGGEFLFCDVPETKKSRRRIVPAVVVQRI